MSQLDNPKQWATGADAPTEKQTSFLNTLAAEKGVEVDTTSMDKGEASAKINELKIKDNQNLSTTGSETIQDPKTWATGDDLATGKQTGYIAVMAKEAGETGPQGKMSKREASEEIQRLKAKTGMHTSPLYENLVQIRNGTFYRHHPSVEKEDTTSANQPLFSNLTFELPSGDKTRPAQHWAVLGTSGVTTFLEILRGIHICIPPNARTYPYLSSDEIERKDHRLRIPSRAIQYVGFNSGKSQGPESGVRGAYLSARYESRREETDWSVLQYLRGETDLNPPEEREGKDSKDEDLLKQVIRDLRLERLVTMPVSNLSNGQTRRARIARALLGKPELLLLDEPFMGLDPPTLVTLSPILRGLAYNASPRLLLALRPQDPIPDWITHVILMGANNTVALMGPKSEVLFRLYRWADKDPQGYTETLDLSMKMAAAMTKAYGPPLAEVGHTLTSNGIVNYEAYAEAKAASNPPVFLSHARKHLSATMNPEVLDETSRERFRAAEAVPYKHRSLSDLLDLTALVPDSSQATQLSESIVEQTTSALGSSAPALGNQGPATVKSAEFGKPLIELSSVVIKYGDKTVLGHPPSQPGFTKPGLNLTVREGTRLALLGPNGSGKTTLLSLLTSDHPHSYSLPIKFFGRSRLPTLGTPGLSLFEIQSRIGHSSPEIHSFFPRNLSIRQTLESAWAETFAARPKLSHAADETVDVFLKWFEPELNPRAPNINTQDSETKSQLKNYMPSKYAIQRQFRSRALGRAMEQSIPPPITPEYPWFPYSSDPEHTLPPISSASLDWAEQLTFRDLPFGAQRLLLLLRALIKKPDILVLDEAFSGLSPDIRDKAMRWLQYGQTRYPKLVKAYGYKFEDRLQWKIVENRRHVFDAACEKLGFIEEELMTIHSMPRPPVATNMREIKWIENDEELERDVKLKEWDREKTYRFMGLEDRQALVVVSHIKEEVPWLVEEWLRLPGEEEVSEQGRGVEMGRCPNGEIRTVEGWNRVWGLA